MSFFTEMLTKEQYEVARPVISQAIPLLEKASTSDKFLLALSILDYVGSGSRRDYPMDFAISYQDGDGLLDEELAAFLNSIASRSPQVLLALAAATTVYLIHEVPSALPTGASA